jgi:glycosyltransferase involved in cell wall biosynthesis
MQKTCVIIPCYNEAARLPRDRFLRYLERNRSVSLCFVNDGSRDGTIDVLRSLEKAGGGKIIVKDLVKNTGKAGAVREGVLEILSAGGFDYIGYFDADLATPLTEINILLGQYREKSRYRFAFASRIKRLGVRVDRDPIRHYIGRIFATTASLLLGLPVYDTQCGAKLMRPDVAAAVFEQPFISRWLFDVEIFARLKGLYGAKKVSEFCIEVPVSEWIEMGDSKIRLADFFKLPVDLLRIAFAYRLFSGKK